MLCLAGRAFASGADIEVLVQNAAGQPVANAVVYAQPPRAEVVAAPRRVNIDQVDKQFAPRVSVIQTGTMVWLPNSDNIRHSVYSISPAKPFTMKLYSGKPSEPILFDKPGIVVLGCNIHDQMAAWVLVVDTPYFARSGADGKVKLVGLPAGSYRLNVWHPSLDAAIDLRPLEVAGGVAQSLSVRIEARVLPEPIPGSSGAYNGGQP
jgi:plastocyanin